MTDVVADEWLADRLDEVRIVDVREPWEYESIGHLPGAVSVPFDSFRAEEHAAEGGAGDASEGGDAGAAEGGGGDAGAAEGGGGDVGAAEGEEGDAAETGGAAEGGGGEGMLPGEERFRELMETAGIGTDDHVVAYDDTHGVFAARFLVTALLYGHDSDRLHLLDGDFSAWQQSGHETTTEAPAPEPTEYEVREPADSPLVDADAVAAAADDPDAVVVDTREGWEYEEGHIPGAVRLDWRELVDDETRGILPRDEALTVLAERGIVPEARIVLYCNTARRISHTYVVLRHLGFETVDFYEGSLTEWERLGRPLESCEGE